MPFNQLLFPLLGGYLLINFTYLASYWASRQSKDQLLLASAIAGLFAAFVSRVLVLLSMLTPAGPWLYGIVHAAAPYEGIGTALLAFFLCVGFRFWINQVWCREDAALWLYDTATYDSLEQLLMQSVIRAEPSSTNRSLWFELPLRLLASIPLIGRGARRKLDDDFVELLSADELIDVDVAHDLENSQEEIAEPVPVMLILKDRKVYVGWVEWLPPLRANSSAYLRIYPSWSGYRDPKNLTVIPTSWYDDVGDVNIQDLPLLKIIPAAEIASASFYDPSVFARFADVGSEASDPTHEGSPQKTEKTVRRNKDQSR